MMERRHRIGVGRVIGHGTIGPMDQLHRQALEAIIRESPHFRHLAIAAGFANLALQIGLAAQEARSMLIVDGKEPSSERSAWTEVAEHPSHGPH